MRDSRPNIILILADDMGFSDVGCFGSEIKTPHLDRLGYGGLRLTQLYNTARCCPSRASLLTGLYPHQAGIGHMVDDWNVGPAYQGWLREDTVTIAEALRTGGYRTMYSGKWHVNWSFEPDAGSLSTSHHNRLGQAGYPHPLQRGFDESYALMAGATSLFNPQHLLRQDQWIEPEQPGYYITDAITDEAVRMIDGSDVIDQPFFLHVAHVAPHWPLHAHQDDIAQYDGVYEKGWDDIRSARHARLQQLGLIKSDWACSPRDPYAPAWNSLSSERKFWEASRMAAYAAMVHRMDHGIGRIVQALQDNDILDNTLIMFLSDNGGCAEFLHEDGWCQWYPDRTHDGRVVRLGDDPNVTPGADDTFMSYGLPWANVSNTPFRLYKHFVHEGGIATPAIMAWPQRIQNASINHAACHIQDIMPTLLDVAGVPCPQERNGVAVQPLEGQSFAPMFVQSPWERVDPICFEHEGNAAVRVGRWKAVRRHPNAWELYDMDADRPESDDLSEKHSDVMQQLQQIYAAWAVRCGVSDWPPGPWPDWMSSDELRNETT